MNELFFGWIAKFKLTLFWRRRSKKWKKCFFSDQNSNLWSDSIELPFCKFNYSWLHSSENIKEPSVQSIFPSRLLWTFRRAIIFLVSTSLIISRDVLLESVLTKTVANYFAIHLRTASQRQGEEERKKDCHTTSHHDIFS